MLPKWFAHRSHKELWRETSLGDKAAAAANSSPKGRSSRKASLGDKAATAAKNNQEGKSRNQSAISEIHNPVVEKSQSLKPLRVFSYLGKTFSYVMFIVERLSWLKYLWRTWLSHSAANKFMLYIWQSSDTYGWSFIVVLADLTIHRRYSGNVLKTNRCHHLPMVWAKPSWQSRIALLQVLICQRPF